MIEWFDGFLPGVVFLSALVFAFGARNNTRLFVCLLILIAVVLAASLR